MLVCLLIDRKDGKVKNILKLDNFRLLFYNLVKLSFLNFNFYYLWDRINKKDLFLNIIVEMEIKMCIIIFNL